MLGSPLGGLITPTGALGDARQSNPPSEPSGAAGSAPAQQAGGPKDADAAPPTQSPSQAAPTTAAPKAEQTKPAENDRAAGVAVEAALADQIARSDAPAPSAKDEIALARAAAERYQETARTQSVIDALSAPVEVMDLAGPAPSTAEAVQPQSGPVVTDPSGLSDARGGLVTDR
ncbi:hypothetical protein [Pseudooctadecabacter jejudonensis]|uniref:Uncharacterized protein n=1 Tax=Pseudooctadecabacter jejudonensis TaxID=1391910 RepID=A0A1Y5SZB0_9RHOB|nr:hypothetical protein [Pseudooctadecabacter jejudonensis]SLN50343.1 hypothetical protein PSJ8397_02624 [Pseudooctadecabacter jejudonensis]